MRKIIFLITLCLSLFARAESVTISAAVSLKEALTDIGKACETQTGDHINFNFAASGPLAAQIEQGAPVDGFISAANKQVDQLLKAGLADAKSRRVIVRNEIVLIAAATNEHSPTDFVGLTNSAVKRIAIGQPQTVPAGQYAMQTLATLKLSESLKNKIVFAGSVRQVLDYVQRDEVDAGIVYATDAKQAGDVVKVLATAEANSHEPIEYPAVVITESKHAAAAEKFFAFLSSPTARDVFVARGFLLPANQPTTVPAP